MINKTNTTKDVDPEEIAEKDFKDFCEAAGELIKKKQVELGLEQRIDMSLYLNKTWNVPFHNALLRVLTIGEKYPNLTLRTITKTLGALDLKLQVVPKNKD